MRKRVPGGQENGPIVPTDWVVIRSCFREVAICLPQKQGLVRRGHTGGLRAAGRGLAKVLALLRMQHAVSEPVRVADTGGVTLIAAFDSHLRHVAGLDAWYAFPVFASRLRTG